MLWVSDGGCLNWWWWVSLTQICLKAGPKRVSCVFLKERIKTQIGIGWPGGQSYTSACANVYLDLVRS